MKCDIQYVSYVVLFIYENHTHTHAHTHIYIYERVKFGSDSILKHDMIYDSWFVTNVVIYDE